MAGDPLPIGWHWANLEQVKYPEGRSIVSGPFGSNIGMRFFVTKGIPVIRGNNLTKDLTRFVDDGFVFLTEEKAKEFKNCEALPGDLIFTAAGTLGQVGIIPNNPKFPRYIISNKQLRARVNEDLVLPLYAYYWYSSPEMVAYIEQRNTGSTIPLINLSILRQLPLPLPPLPEQKKIVEFISNLDDKIELNRRMNRTLEEMAAAIFKSWFVDFDPVVAKSEGRKPFGMSEDVAKLFPSSFIDSQIGLIPNRWDVVPVGNMANVVGGGTPSTNKPEYWENGTFHWATPKDLSKLTDPVLLDTDRKITDAGLGQISSGLLPKGTVLLSSRAPVGYLVISEIPVAVNQGFIAIICDKGIPNLYIYHWLHENMDTIIANANGTTFLEISKSNFRPIPAIKPPIALLEAFIKVIGPLFKRIVNNTKEKMMLANLRDTLLPKLLSGEIRLKQAEKMVEEI
jgi:type I restriction enzyme, S subunit